MRWYPMGATSGRCSGRMTSLCSTRIRAIGRSGKCSHARHCWWAFRCSWPVLGRRRPYLVTGWLWFLGTMMPVIGLVQVGIQSMADRYTYVPLIGLFIMVVWGIGRSVGRASAAGMARPDVCRGGCGGLGGVRRVDRAASSVLEGQRGAVQAGGAGYKQQLPRLQQPGVLLLRQGPEGTKPWSNIGCL